MRRFLWQKHFGGATRYFYVYSNMSWFYFKKWYTGGNWDAGGGWQTVDRRSKAPSNELFTLRVTWLAEPEAAWSQTRAAPLTELCAWSETESNSFTADRPLNDVQNIFRSVSFAWDFTTYCQFRRALCCLRSHVTLFFNAVFNSNGMLTLLISSCSGNREISLQLCFSKISWLHVFGIMYIFWPDNQHG